MGDVDLETVRNVALVAIVAIAVLGIAVALVLKAIVAKLAVLAVVAVAGFALWANRTSVTDCIGQVQEAVGADGQAPSCTFLGVDVDVPVP